MNIIQNSKRLDNFNKINTTAMLFKKYYIWILLFGSLIGLNETLIGSSNLHYRSVILSTITLSLLSLARWYIPKTGTSMLIILIAILFKINNVGIHTCNTNVLLCGPTALLLLGIGYEVFASIFVSKKPFNYRNYVLTCIMTSLLMLAVFAVLQTYILRSWDTARLVEYIFVKGSLTAVASSTLSVSGLYLAKKFRSVNFAKLHPYIVNGILVGVVIALWVFGYNTT
ncbi:hypothetical protein H8E88_01250 [candidate division KSB1 bacterium]|nr:hypothetical protein [candidate division KSB1 bacterium]